MVQDQTPYTLMLFSKVETVEHQNRISLTKYSRIRCYTCEPKMNNVSPKRVERSYDAMW